MTETKLDPEQYIIDAGVTVSSLDMEALQQECCKLIDYLENYSELTQSLVDLGYRWRKNK